MDQNKAKAFLAIIIASVVILTSYVMFFSNTSLDATSAISRTPPQTAPTAPSDQGDTSGTGASGNSDAVSTQGNGRGTSGGSGGGSNGGTSDGTNDGTNEGTGSNGDPAPLDKRVANFEGYWGRVNNPEPISTLTGVVFAMGADVYGNFIQPWVSMEGTLQGVTTFIRFPIKETHFNGYMSFHRNWSEPETVEGNYWKETNDPGIFISIFSWDDEQYWMYGQYQKIPGNGHGASDKTTSAFNGYWGAVASPEPLASLQGQVVAEGASSTGNLIQPWLVMTGPYQGHQLQIRFPLTNQSFQGYILIPTDASDIKSCLMTGSYWYEHGGTGYLFSFVTWKGNVYWIFGEGNNL
jgi:hypothetical protein